MFTLLSMLYCNRTRAGSSPVATLFLCLLVCLLLIVSAVAMGWLIQGNDFIAFRYFAPKYAAVERETFEQTKSYRQGMVQELQNMRFQYEQATVEHRAALASVIRHRAADFPSEQMPPELAEFVRSLNSVPAPTPAGR